MLLRFLKNCMKTSENVLTKSTRFLSFPTIANYCHGRQPRFYFSHFILPTCCIFVPCPTRCMIKIFRGGSRGGDTFNPPPPTNNFCLYPPPVLRCFWKDPLMTPTPYHATSSILHCYPPPHPPPLPTRKFDHIPGSRQHRFPVS